MKDTLRLEDLRLFCQVAHKTSFATTARELGISKANVSKRIGMLEAALQGRDCTVPRSGSASPITAGSCGNGR